jgi:MYXO-CTERM domain-containing protein
MRKWSGLMALVALAGGGSARAAMNGLDGSLASDAAAAVDAASDAVGGSSDAGTDADACAKTCPTAEPAVGDPCDLPGECEYGDDPRFECNRQYACSSGHFQTLQEADAGCPTVLAAGCPPTRASLIAGAACATTGLQCTYVEGECQCEMSFTDGGSAWFCLPENTLVGSDVVCPVPRPRLGTSCSLQSAVYCSYESNCTFQACNPCGEWVLGYVPCGQAPPPLLMDGGTAALLMDGGTEGGGDSSVDGSFRGDGASAGSGAVGNSGGCGCGVDDQRSGTGASAGGILGIALLARRRRSEVSRRSAV